MTDALVPRGPDDAGVWTSGPVALGHRRLSIIDLSNRGAQPMVDPELGLTVVFNGCIYNHRELRTELERAGYRFFSDSDTEVVVKAYHRWGPSAVDHLAGMFAFCAVERDGGRVVIARDRLGIKPVYLDVRPGFVRFASTLPALLAGGGVDTDIDPVGLHHYLTFHSIVPAPHTILSGIRKLPPGTILTIEPDGRCHFHTYWRAEATDEDRSSWNDRDWQDAMAEALRTAVRRRLVADVDVGVLLSGGLDSSLLVALVAEEQGEALSTFSIGFEASGGMEGDEFRWSDRVAQEFSTDHHRIRIGSDQLVKALPEAVRAMSEPMASHDVVAFWLLSREVARHVKVVQSGQGADEVFAGYHWFGPLAELAPERAADAYLAGFRDRSHAAMAHLVEAGHRVDHDVSAALVRDHMASPGAASALDRALRFEIEVMMADDPVKRVDNMTMDAGLEARVPFLDADLVQLAAACPADLKLADGGKGVLKDIGRKLLPVDVVDRPKGYFPVPGLVHLDETTTAVLREVLTSKAAADRGIVRPAHLERLLAEPNAAITPTNGNELWQIAVLEWWLQEHVDR